MKRKFSKILGVGLTLALLTSLLLTAAPVAAAEEDTSSGSGDNPGTVVITPIDIELPYVVGIGREFSVATTSDDAYDPVRYNFVVENAALGDITSFEYYDAETEGWTNPATNPDPLVTNTWIPLDLTVSGSDLVGYFGPVDGFPMTAGWDVTTKFRVTFSAIKTYPVTVSLVLMPGETPIKSAAFSLEVVAVVPSTISITAPGDFSFGDFIVGDNPAASVENGQVNYSQGNDGATGWTVTAQDNNQDVNTGKMLRTTPVDSHPLTAELLISGDATVTYKNASGTPEMLTYTGIASGPYTFDAKQSIASDDFAGTYTITIIFVGSLDI